MAALDRALDLAGVGLGPSNLALAIAVDERNTQVPPVHAVTAEFYERKPRFGWHQGMLIDGSLMQVSFLKDLVTMRNPRSRYTFLNYLQANDRLVDFINHKCLFPSRAEYHQYLEWAAGQFVHQVRYDAEVVGARPTVRDGVVTHFEVDVACRGDHGSVSIVRPARNLVLATGLVPSLPAGAVLSERTWHSSELLRRVGALPARPSRIVVLGAGQSAAEVTEYLHRTFPTAEICALFERYGYSPADNSPFANRIFDPEAVDVFFDAPEAVKESLLDYHRNTNYGVVDPDLIDELYRRWYQEKVTGARRLRLFNASRLAGVEPLPDGVEATVEHTVTGMSTVLRADALVYATGYQPADPTRALGEAAALLVRDDRGRLAFERDYRVRTAVPVAGGIYLQGGTEHTHGITSSLLSNSAIRAAEIVRSIADRRRRAAPAAMGTSHA